MTPPIPTVFAEVAGVRVPRDVIRATGPDTEAFLQGQLSQDVVALAQGGSAWSLLLQPQGKVDAWLRVTRLGDSSFLLDVDADAGEATLTRLRRFLLRTDCTLALETWDTVALRGPGSAEVAAAVEVDGTTVVATAPAEWPSTEGIDLLGPSVAMPEGIAEATAGQYERLRILAGVPAMGAELTDATIPAEAGIVDQSVSFTKGCYTGQELVARIDSRGGNVPRHLRGISSDGSLTVGSPVVVDGEEVGAVTSAQDGIGLAYIKRSVDAFPSPATVAGESATIHPLPMLEG